MAFKRFETRDALTEVLAQRIGDLLLADIERQGVAAIAVSGGNTPKPLFQALSNFDLPWEKVMVTLVDERWVSPEDEASNEKLVRSFFLQNLASKAQFIPHKNSAESPFQGEEALAGELAELPEQFTLVILGMGEDGHTASFFPGAETLSEAIDMDSGKLCQGVVPQTAPHARMTLTLPRLLKSQQIVLHLTGAGKLPVYEKALERGDLEALPVRTVLHQDQTPVDVYWAE